MKLFDCSDQNLRKKLELNLSEFVLLHNIYERAGAGKWACRTTKDEIGDYLGISKQTVYNHIEKLTKSGYIRYGEPGALYITERLIRAL